MGVTCRDLLAMPELAALHLVGGAEGLDRVIQWVHFADSVTDGLSSAQWLNGHELVFITGSATAPSTGQLIELLARLNDSGIAGLVINVGPYIADISQEIIDEANALQLPLFRLPWEVKLVNITHVICNAIITRELRHSRDSNVLEELLFGEEHSSHELKDTLTEKHLLAERGCVIGVCAIMNPGLLTHGPDAIALAMDRENNLQHRLDNAFLQAGLRELSMAKDSTVIFLVPALPDLKSRLSRLLGFVEADLAMDCPGLRIHTCLSDPSGDRPDLKRCLHQAEQVLEAVRIRPTESRITAHEDLGLFGLLLSVEDRALLEVYFNRTLGALVEYDRINRTDLYHTLSEYCNHDCNLQATAQVLFVHKNTLKYRLERIGDILGCDIRLNDAFLRIGVGLQIGEILRAHSNH